MRSSLVTSRRTGAVGQAGEILDALRLSDVVAVSTWPRQALAAQSFVDLARGTARRR
ncbi:hypothetical protein ACRAWF_38380 [Streptomyces sp. L7]